MVRFAIGTQVVRVESSCDCCKVLNVSVADKPGCSGTEGEEDKSKKSTKERKVKTSIVELVRCQKNRCVRNIVNRGENTVGRVD